MFDRVRFDKICKRERKIKVPNYIWNYRILLILMRQYHLLSIHFYSCIFILIKEIVYLIFFFFIFFRIVSLEFTFLSGSLFLISSPLDWCIILFYCYMVDLTCVIGMSSRIENRVPGNLIWLLCIILTHTYIINFWNKSLFYLHVYPPFLVNNCY